MEDLRGLAGLSLLCMGGNVEDRPGGERAIIEGSRSRGRGEWNGGMEFCARWFCIGGSSMVECIFGCLASFSDGYSCGGIMWSIDVIRWRASSS